MGEVVKVAELKDVPLDEGISVTHGSERIALFNVGGRIYAISDACPHQGGPLSDGWIDGTEVTCPWHGWSFDLERPEGINQDGIYRYKVVVDGEDIKIEIP